ncbi:MAG: hypothetical protein ACXWZ3_04805 [Solirubrobacterales bacterium]
MKDATKLKVATAVTVLFLAAISVAGLVNRSGDAGAAAAPAQSARTVQATAQQPAVAPSYSDEGDEDEGYEKDADEGYEEDDD